MKKNIKGPVILLICALVWGFAFSAQDTAMEHMGPFTFVFLRSVITAILLYLVCLLRYRKHPPEKGEVLATFKLGALLGLLLVAAVSLQQVGIVYTTPAKSGFITALYIVMIPLVGVLSRKKIGAKLWCGVLLSLVGLALLCLGDDMSINIGDVITLNCAIIFALHIIFVDRLASDMDPILLCAVQFTVCAIIGGILTAIFETPDIREISVAMPSVLYTAVFSGAIGYTLQFYGQKYTPPTEASLLMCLESFFAAIGGWLLLGQALSPREILGCCLMLSASMLVQIPERKKQTAE